MITAGAQIQPARNYKCPSWAIPAGIALTYIATLLELFSQHGWILDTRGKPATVDFLAIWTAGRLALTGRAEGLYDPQVSHLAQIAVAGHSFPGYFFWNYPPVFLFVAAALAAVPYTVAFLGWVVLSGIGYAASIKSIAGRWEAVLFVCASPAILLNTYLGQTGFFTAALLGGFLVFLPSRPLVSGILLGLMTYKPQFGILIPLALIAGGCWRTIGVAALTAAATATAAALAFGTGSYASFLHSLPVASNAYLTLGEEGWTKMQSIYSVARFLGAGGNLAWVAQGGVICSCGVAIMVLWRSRVDYELKAAGLVTAAMLSTPYVHVYDFPVLLVAMAFLYRQRSFDRIEWEAIVVANIAMALFLAQLAPIGPAILGLVCGLILRRFCRATAPATENSASPAFARS